MSDVDDVANRTVKAISEGRIADAVASYSPDVVLDMRPFGIPGFDLFEGRDQVGAAIRQFIDNFEDYRMELVSRTDLEGGRSLWVIEQSGRGGESGVEVTMRYAQIADFEDGSFTRFVVYADEEQARRAAGLDSG